jgi:spermidine synthase
MLARREFALNAIDLEIILSSGQDFMRTTRRHFDLIIDDMWPMKPHSPKVITTEQRWTSLIHTRLRAGGVYTINLYDRVEHPSEIPAVSSILRRRFASLFEVRPPHGQTTTIAAGNETLSPRRARKRIRSLSRDHALKLGQLTFRNLSYHST